MKTFVIVIAIGLAGITTGQRFGQSQQQQRTTTTPVPILKQINKVNEDGSYTYGYENADGSYKIETKDVKGQVQGKYGYYDDAGKLREVEYGASRGGFYPQGTDINAPEVAPPLNVEGPQDGSYDPELYTYPYQPSYDRSAAAPVQNQLAFPSTAGRRLRVNKGPRRQQQNNGGDFSRQLQSFQQFQEQQQPRPQQQVYQPQPQPQQNFYQPQQQQYQPQPQQPQQNFYQPQPLPVAPTNPPNYYQQPQAPIHNNAQLFHGHPARNIDLNTGSYSINYSG